MRVSEWLHIRSLDTRKTRIPRSIYAHLFETRVRSTYLQWMQNILRLALQRPGQRYVIYPAAFPREYVCIYTDLATSYFSAEQEVHLYIDYPDPTAPEDMPPLLYTCSPEHDQELEAILLEWKNHSYKNACHILDRYLDLDWFDPLDPDMALVCTVYDSSMVPCHRVLMEIAIPGTPNNATRISHATSV